jgi:enoyl-CoA hydratase/carnithine racemase
MSGAEIDVVRNDVPGGRVAWVTVHNSARLNILDSNGFDALAEAFEGLADDGELRLAILTGDGEKAFIGGADIREMLKLDSGLAREFIGRLGRATAAIRALPVPVIARIDGYTLGAGLEIAASCDLRAASDRSTFGMPEVRVGIPSVVEAVLLPRLIGWGRTCELVLTGEIISAQDALDWGLIERLTAADELDDTIARWIDAIVSAGPEAIRLQKSLMTVWESEPMAESIATSVETFADAFKTDEPRRLMQAFLDRRKR